VILAAQTKFSLFLYVFLAEKFLLDGLFHFHCAKSLWSFKMFRNKHSHLLLTFRTKLPQHLGLYQKKHVGFVFFLFLFCCLMPNITKKAIFHCGYSAVCLAGGIPFDVK